mmetsp:Transcript_25161/g.59142  ORF Transcript_25161/g.59142 Transcript_25161/m.59142 type:complete len:260 (-) Transcript_25161:207-986(-)
MGWALLATLPAGTLHQETHVITAGMTARMQPLRRRGPHPPILLDAHASACVHQLGRRSCTDSTEIDMPRCRRRVWDLQRIAESVSIRVAAKHGFCTAARSLTVLKCWGILLLGRPASNQKLLGREGGPDSLLKFFQQVLALLRDALEQLCAQPVAAAAAPMRYDEEKILQSHALEQPKHLATRSRVMVVLALHVHLTIKRRDDAIRIWPAPNRLELWAFLQGLQNVRNLKWIHHAADMCLKCASIWVRPPLAGRHGAHW